MSVPEMARSAGERILGVSCCGMIQVPRVVGDLGWGDTKGKELFAINSTKLEEVGLG
jgi:hypothetical protein